MSTESTTPTIARAQSPELEPTIALLRGRRIAVLTGAGVSTDSGIPDYRGAGAPPRTPMTFQRFVEDEAYRKRYWAGSHVGWQRFSGARPNGGHAAIAGLEAAGLVAGVVTQNVDGLHVRAGSRRVVDLHGSMDRVVCLDCGQHFARADVALRIALQNPGIVVSAEGELAPDGDADVAGIDEFVVPDCSVCGGVLKPDVVFFGELVPTERFAEAAAIVTGAEVLLVAGSSLVVNSGIRLVEQATRNRMPIVVVNRGVTKADGRAAVKIEAGTTETLVRLRDHLVG